MKNKLNTFTLAEGATHVDMLPTVVKFGFTLAEVLITLGIIGVVAAMTIPTLFTIYRKNTTVNKLKKSYAELAMAIKLSEYENEDVSGWDMTLSSDKFINQYLKPYIKHNEQKASQINNKLHYKFPNGKNFNLAILTNGETSTFTMQNGAILFVDNWFDKTTKRRGIAIDINGIEKPNIRGIDVFEFFISNIDGLQPKGYDIPLADIQNPNKQYSCSDSGNSEAYSCTAWIVKNNWKIPPNYPWK